jgi:hypothetical protein
MQAAGMKATQPLHFKRAGQSLLAKTVLEPKTIGPPITASPALASGLPRQVHLQANKQAPAPHYYE